MGSQLLQINFRFTVGRDEYEAMLGALTEVYAAIPGCAWKIWLMNEERQEAGGIYLFTDRASLEAYLQSPLAAAAASHPSFAGFEVKQFDVLEDVSRKTRAPLPSLTVGR